MDRDEAKAIEREVRQFLTTSGSADELIGRINEGLGSSDDPGAIGLLMLGRTLARQSGDDPAELAGDAMTAASLLEEAGELDASTFAESLAGALLHRAGDVDAATDIAVRSLAALEQMPTTEEWGSRTAHALGVLFGDLHAYELAARSSARSLAWSEAAADPTIRLTVEGCRAFYLLRAAETYEAGSTRRAECIALATQSLDALRELGDPVAAVVIDSVEAEIEFLSGSVPDPDRLEALRDLLDSCAPPWVAWHEHLHGRALNAADRHQEAIACLRHSLEQGWPLLRRITRREIARSLAAIGRTDMAIDELHEVLEDLEEFVRSHVARQARDLADRVEAEKHASVLQQQSAHLADQVAHDHLTGVSSRRALDSYLDQPVDGTTTHAVFVCDLDHFKMVNDAYGHEVGDEVLKIVGQILIDHSRAEDVAGRLGGEEFVVIQRNDLGNGADAAERLRLAVQSVPWDDIAEDLRVTISIGVAAGTSPLRDLLRAADMAVYDAKDAGRNRVHLAFADVGDIDDEDDAYADLDIAHSA
ncbi:MAG: GGDEF domain-containing protein [Actinomycetota bacterium]